MSAGVLTGCCGIVLNTGNFCSTCGSSRRKAGGQQEQSCGRVIQPLPGPNIPCWERKVLAFKRCQASGISWFH
eukprot:6478860-Amphidinium_carterae.1